MLKSVDNEHAEVIISFIRNYFMSLIEGRLQRCSLPEPAMYSATTKEREGTT